jgi:hypothetical protein
MIAHLQSENSLDRHKERLRVETSELARDVRGNNTANITSVDEQMLLTLESLQIQLA